VVQACEGSTLGFDLIGPVALKGLSGTIELFTARRAPG
jgi:hypothetical protein